MVSILLLSLHNANGARRFILGLLLAKSTRAEGIIPKIDLLREMGVRICQLVDGGGSDPGYDSASDSDDGRTAVDSLTEPNFRDEYERELRVMADVRAYFQIAYKVSTVGSYRSTLNVPSSNCFFFAEDHRLCPAENRAVP